VRCDSNVAQRNFVATDGNCSYVKEVENFKLLGMHMRIKMFPSGLLSSVWLSLACNTDTTPTSHTETPTHIETRTQNQRGDTIEKSQAADDGCINARNTLSIEEVK